MTHYLNYFSHKFNIPEDFQWLSPFDLPKEDLESSELNAARVFNAALPFIRMIPGPLSQIEPIALNGKRVYTHLNLLVKADTNTSRAYEFVQVTFSIAIFAVYAFGLQTGLMISAGVTGVTGIATSLVETRALLKEGKNKEAFGEFLTGVSRCLELGIMVTGSLELVLASCFIRGSINFNQAKKEYNGKRRWLEIVSNTLLGVVQTSKAKKQYSLIQRRNFLYAIEEYKNLIARLDKGKNIEHLLDHPLAGLACKVDEQKIVFVDPDGNEYDFGTNFFGNGEGLVKGMNIRFKKQEDKLELDFKVNHVFRDKIQEKIENLESFKNKDDLNDLLKFSKVNAEGISIEKTELNFQKHGRLGPTYQITLDGLGKIFIGATDKYLNQYDRVCIQMEEGKNLFDFHQILTVLDLDTALKQSAIEDVNRMKMGQLFRILHPTKATLFERTEEFFNLPIEELRNKMVELEPKMSQDFEKYLHRMELREIMPGRMRFAINGLADELRELGALGLTAATTGAETKNESYKRVDLILSQTGMLATEIRHSNGVSQEGLANDLNHKTGGSVSVFTQLVTDKVRSFDDFMYHGWGNVSVLFSLEALETGTYQYHDDSFGYRRLEDKWRWTKEKYLDREDIFTFVKNETDDPYESFEFFGHTFDWFKFFGNEVMIKERIGPEYITGFVVDNESNKRNLIEHLKKSGSCHIDSNGDAIITSLGRKAKECIHVGDKISGNYFQ